ncbi:hypothetical protein D7Z26_13785 [Cohnella endophytica]|uniref:PepSY domain-containing protein n=1 Tax=Cohnella endophytica TaxID=2419778 RepID=A0A494XV27_9BACL|nr:hypothetical protein [Cohnella endophytica]RKP54418.1 hypothetical protein D7Z26_13785 [Cohnella endophytica]
MKRIVMIGLLILAVSLTGCTGQSIERASSKDPNSTGTPSRKSVQAKVTPSASATSGLVTDGLTPVNAAELREAAWFQLQENEKKTVVGDWKSAEVLPARWSEVTIKIEIKEPPTVYRVTFETSNDQLLGPIVVFLDPLNNQIVGYEARR